MSRGTSRQPKLWYSADELVGAPEMPASRVEVESLATRDAWRHRRRGQSIEFHFESLPRRTRDHLVVPVVVVDSSDWSRYEALPESIRAEAERRLAAIDQVESLIAAGTSKRDAFAAAARETGVAARTIRRWQTSVCGVHPSERLPLLAPRYAGGTSPGADVSPEAWDMIRADYLRPEAPSIAACYERLMRVARTKGWTVPSRRTIERRLNQIPMQVRLLARSGRQALKQAYPAQERDRTAFQALEAVNADGHKFDVFVAWPDGTIARPVMLAWQDLYSGKLLSYRVDRTEHRDLVRLSFGDLVERFGIPSQAWLDNGRAFASKWLTGGTPTRFRFKVKAEDPLGILTQVGVDVHWTTPYHGQAKPIERAFRDLCDYVAKHPAFAGAYTGNSVEAKPENYRSRAIPLDRFLKVLEQEITAHNGRTGRRAASCMGRSFDDTFAASYERAPIKRATVEQRRLWLLAAEGVTASRVDASVRIAGNRYWSEALASHAGEALVVRFDPDDLHERVFVYAKDGRYIGEAECIQASGFADSEKAREHARARKAWIRAQRDQLDAERRMSASEVAALLPTTDEPVVNPNPKVVRAKFGDALTAATANVADEDDREDAFQRTVSELWNRHKQEIL